MKKIILGVVLGWLIITLIVWAVEHKSAYVGPVMQTSTGGQYFCTFEDKSVFEEYMMEQPHE